MFDHLVVAVRSLVEGVAEFERLTGIAPTIGGVHPGRGTENALVSLGPGRYFEIIAPQPEARLSPADEVMRSLERLRILAWAVSVPDVDVAAATLAASGFATTPPQPGSRLTPAGERLEWTTFRLADRTLAGAPFFIAWHRGTTHPSLTAPSGCSLESLTITTPASDRLAAALNALGVTDLRCAPGTTAIEARVRAGRKQAVFGSLIADRSS